MHLSNRGDASADRNWHWNPGVRKTPAEMGDFPPFQLRIPCRSPMQSKSQFLYTSPASQRIRKIPRLERGGAQDPPLASYLPGYSLTSGPRSSDTPSDSPPLTARHRRRPPLRDQRHSAQENRPGHTSFTLQSTRTAIQSVR